MLLVKDSTDYKELAVLQRVVKNVLLESCALLSSGGATKTVFTYSQNLFCQQQKKTIYSFVWVCLH